MILALRPKYPGLSLLRMCQLLGVPRSLCYRKASDRPERARFYKALRFELLSVFGVHPYYGYRRFTHELRHRGLPCGFKSVRRAMKEEGIVYKRPRRVARTSDGKGRGSWPNLLKEETATAPSQIFVADITYIGIPGGFGYLACVLDLFQRKIVGWAMSRRIDAALTLSALREAIQKGKPEAGWIHHSDRGSQYLSHEYVNEVTQAKGRISCSDKACPQDNAFMESFFKTLKVEEVWLEAYEDFLHAQNGVQGYIAKYNARRLHSSLGYMSPEQFEAQFRENNNT